MEKHRPIKAIRGEEIQLPEEIIQQIQSFLSGKEAARTTILSKSWYTAWLTRPNLDFSYSDIPMEFVKKTLQRYDESNAKIHTFRLQVNAHDYTRVTVSTTKELILKAMELGATDLCISGGWMYTLPLPSDMFVSEALVRLSLSNCKIDLRGKKVTCTKLKYLNLSYTNIESDSFWDIIVKCPLIEELIVNNLKIEPGLVAYDSHKLKVLYLNNVGFGEWLFRDLSSKFPCLKELTLDKCGGYEKIQICSDSLEFISLSGRVEGMWAAFDVPRIRKFVYSAPYVPSLSIKTISTEWESDITITLISPELKPSWFVEFREFLLELSPSDICLHLGMSIEALCSNPYINCSNPYINWSPDHDIRDIVGLDKPPIVVENLTLQMYIPYSICHALLDGLFRFCHPISVNLYYLPSRQRKSKANNDFTEHLCKTLIKENGEEGSMSALHDLEDVHVKFFEDDPVEGCTPLPCMTFSDASAKAYFGSVKIKVCLQLRWEIQSDEEESNEDEEEDGNGDGGEDDDDDDEQADEDEE